MTQVFGTIWLEGSLDRLNMGGGVEEPVDLRLLDIVIIRLGPRESASLIVARVQEIQREDVHVASGGQ